MNQLTSSDLIAMLRKRFNKLSPGGAPRYLLGQEVRLTSFDSPRIADVIIQDTWTGGGGAQSLTAYPRHGFEIKISRSDWLLELSQPDKAQAFIPYTHYWNLLVSDPSIVKEGELPHGWGLIAPSHRGLRQIIQPHLNLEIKPMPLGMSISLMRRITEEARYQERMKLAKEYSTQNSNEKVA